MKASYDKQQLLLIFYSADIRIINRQADIHRRKGQGENFFFFFLVDNPVISFINGQ